MCHMVDFYNVVDSSITIGDDDDNFFFQMIVTISPMIKRETRINVKTDLIDINSQQITRY